MLMAPPCLLPQDLSGSQARFRPGPPAHGREGRRTPCELDVPGPVATTDGP